MPIPNSNRAPSPISSRNSDPNSTTRRSFSGNPSSKPSVLTNPRSFNPTTTPANSLSGFGRRLSAGNEGTDEKENEQSTKPVKPRSSATGSKNFMAPTISAACKLSPSPRKKVLEERNEPVRSSISLSEGIFSSTAEGVGPKSDGKSVEAQMESIASDSEQKKVILERPFGSKPVKRVAFADSTLDSRNSTEFEAESVVMKSDCVVNDLSAKNESSSDPASRIIAPLDADPSCLPYDPKTNYLSPRPQFLYYKPNPRVAVLVDKENGMDDEGVRRLEDTFASSENSSSDTSDSVEEILDSDDSQRDSENSSFVEEEKEEDQKEEDIHGSESLIYKRKNVHESSLKVVEGKVKDKKVLPKRLILICSMLVVLLISCYSFLATYSPGTDSTILKSLNISQLNQPAAVVDLAKANLNMFSQRFKKFSIESISHLVNIGQGGGHLSPPLQFMNLTELQNDILVGKKSPEWDDLEVENSDSADDDDVEEGKTDEIVETFKEETFGEYVSDSSIEHEPEIENDLLPIEALPPASETISNQEEAASDLDIESHDYVDPEHFADLTLEDHKQDNHECDVNLESDANVEPLPEEYVAITPVLEVGIENNPKNLEGNVNLESAANVEPLQDYVQPEEYAATIAPVFEVGIDTNLEILEGNVNIESDANVELLSEDINVDTPSDANHPPNAKTRTSAYHLMGTTALVLALLSISFAAFINKKRGNGSERKLGVDTTNDETLTKKTILTTSSSSMEQLYQEKLSSHNWQTIDDVGESFSSAMSSYQSHHKNRSRSAANDEAHSGGEERRPRKYSKRESFSSSDFSLGGGGGSHSYGSFTTYERIPIKKAIGDDEVVTPVRRSSRLRSHVTS